MKKSIKEVSGLVINWICSSIVEFRNEQQLRCLFKYGLPPAQKRLHMKYRYEDLIFVDESLNIQKETKWIDTCNNK
jgi:hypothetical protein